MTITIYHNPDCGTSRNVLSIIRAAGYDPVVKLYIDTGWTKAKLSKMFAAAEITPRQALRISKSPAKELGLTDPSVSDKELLKAMLAHPVLVNRPFVQTGFGTKLCRPAEIVLDLLENNPQSTVYSETGDVILEVEAETTGLWSDLDS